MVTTPIRPDDAIPEIPSAPKKKSHNGWIIAGVVLVLAGSAMIGHHSSATPTTSNPAIAELNVILDSRPDLVQTVCSSYDQALAAGLDDDALFDVAESQGAFASLAGSGITDREAFDLVVSRC